MPYKLPTIVRPKNGEWFIKYFYEYPDRPGEFKEFRVRDGVNRIHDPEQKEQEIQCLLRDVTYALENLNFSPFEKKVKVARQIHEKENEFAAEDAAADVRNQFWTLPIALDKYIDYCKWKELSENTVRTYQTFVNNFKLWIEEKNLQQVRACEYTEYQVSEFLDYFYYEEDWSPRTYNNHLAFLSTFFSRSLKLERKKLKDQKINVKIEYAIDLSDMEEKVDNAEKNRYYSAHVAAKVKKELAKPKYEKLNRYAKWIFYSCMRPREIRLLQIQHIDLEKRQIKAIGPTAKTGDRFVPISDELLDLINEFEIHKYPVNYYLFGHPGRPDAKPYFIDYFSKVYFGIKEKLGLDKNYTLYGWKHTRVVNLIYAGFKDREIMALTGHRDAKSFEQYKRDLVLDPDNKMSGKTISF